MEDRGTSGDEHLLFENGAGNVGVWPDQTMVADRAIVALSCSNNRILHDDTTVPDSNGTATFPYDSRSVQNARSGSDHHVSANRGIGRDPSRRIYFRSLTVVHNQHACPLSNRLASTLAVYLAFAATCSISVARVPIGQSRPTHIVWSHSLQVVRPKARQVVAAPRSVSTACSKAILSGFPSALSRSFMASRRAVCSKRARWRPARVMHKTVVRPLRPSRLT